MAAQSEDVPEWFPDIWISGQVAEPQDLLSTGTIASVCVKDGDPVQNGRDTNNDPIKKSVGIVHETPVVQVLMETPRDVN